MKCDLREFPNRAVGSATTQPPPPQSCALWFCWEICAAAAKSIRHMYDYIITDVPPWQLCSRLRSIPRQLGKLSIYMYVYISYSHRRHSAKRFFIVSPARASLNSPLPSRQTDRIHRKSTRGFPDPRRASRCCASDSEISPKLFVYLVGKRGKHFRALTAAPPHPLRLHSARFSSLHPLPVRVFVRWRYLISRLSFRRREAIYRRWYRIGNKPARGMLARLIHVNLLIKSKSAPAILARRFWIHYNDTRHDIRTDPSACALNTINLGLCSLLLDQFFQARLTIPRAITWPPKNRDHGVLAFARFLRAGRSSW